MLIFFVVLLILIVFSAFWVNGIDTMKEQYPDYKGEDFLQ